MTGIKIVEIKARIDDDALIQSVLAQRKAIFKGLDHQVDTYFVVPHGRLKLREGSIENHLIQYHRANTAEAKLSEVGLYKTQPNASLKSLLTAALGILAIVNKEREIYFIDNIKIHIDTVKGLGRFAEIEAIDESKQYTEEELRRQCNELQEAFGINEDQLLTHSYSDMILALQD